jgi:hypothetical protein
MIYDVNRWGFRKWLCERAVLKRSGLRKNGPLGEKTSWPPTPVLQNKFHFSTPNNSI